MSVLTKQASKKQQIRYIGSFDGFGSPPCMTTACAVLAWLFKTSTKTV
nr:hypothetical protein EC90111_C0009 [Escherichia coli 9.0111]